MSRSLPFLSVNTTIRVFRQALSLDEVRGVGTSTNDNLILSIS